MVLHCTVGDVLIALATVTAALLALGSPSWPEQRFAAVMLGTVAVAVVTPIAVEYLSTVVWQSWTYTEATPTLPWFSAPACRPWRSGWSCPLWRSCRPDANQHRNPLRKAHHSAGMWTLLRSEALTAASRGSRHPLTIA